MIFCFVQEMLFNATAIAKSQNYWSMMYIHPLHSYIILINIIAVVYLRNEFNFWSVYGIINTPGLLQSK